MCSLATTFLTPFLTVRCRQVARRQTLCQLRVVKLAGARSRTPTFRPTSSFLKPI